MSNECSLHCHDSSVLLVPQRSWPCDLQTVSLISGSLAEDSAVYYFVGTAYVDPEEREPTKGRILVLQVHMPLGLHSNRMHLQQKHRNAAEGPCQQLSLA